MSENIVLQTQKGQFTCRVAAIILCEDKILMVKHKDYDCLYTVGGKVKIGESTEEAVIREAIEETKCNYEIERLAFIHERFFTFNGMKQHEMIFYYYMKENDETRYLEGRNTDQGINETLHLLNIKDLPNENVIPDFFKTIEIKRETAITHIISKED